MTANQFYRALQEYLQKEDNGLKQNIKDKLSCIKDGDIVIGDFPTITVYTFDYVCRGFGSDSEHTYRFPLTRQYSSEWCWFYTGDEKAAQKNFDLDRGIAEIGGYKAWSREHTLLPHGDWEDAIRIDASGKLRHEFHKYKAFLDTLVEIEILEYSQNKFVKQQSGRAAPVFGNLRKEDGTVETIRLGYIHNDNGTEKIILDLAQAKKKIGGSSDVPTWVWIVGGVGLFVFPPVGIGFLIYGIIKALMSK